MIRRARVPLLGLLLLLAACGGRSSTQGQRLDRNLLSEEEMLAAGYSDALTTVQSLRPQWLNKRGVSSINLQESIKVYLDNSLMGGPEQLQQITTRSISTIRYLDGIAATSRWGLDHGQGAIMVSTRRETGR
jgi:hypothetical protein